MKSFLVTPKVKMDLYKSQIEGSIGSSLRQLENSKGEERKKDLLDEDCNFREKYYILVDGCILQYGYEVCDNVNGTSPQFVLPPEAIL